MLRVVVFLGFAGVQVNSFLDYGNFASSKPPAALDFHDPGIPPPSFIYASEQLRPPYDIDVDTREPSPGCDSSTASVCAVQYSIRLVTQARWNACPDLDLGGDKRAQALAVLTAGNYSLEDEGASGFDVFAFSEAGEILADPIRPDLVGDFLDSRNSSGKIPQSNLLAHIDWVVRWSGGFVPHISTRLSSQENPLPLSVVSYVESCPGSGIRLAVTFGRRPIPRAEHCDVASNGFCAWQNVQSIQGRMVVDYLTVQSAMGVSEVYWNVSYSDDMRVGAFYGGMAMLSWVGYPGPDSYRNPTGLPDTYMGQVASGGSPATTGMNASELLAESTEMRDGIPLGRWLAYYMGKAAWSGGSVVDYQWSTAALGEHHKVSLVSGVVFNQTATYIVTGAVHRPQDVVSGPFCTTCPVNYSLSCSLLNVKSLVAHARLDMLVPGHEWDRLTYNPWFGAYHEEAEVNEFSGHWPEGFHVKAFAWNSGLCVADGSNPTNVGKTADEIFGNSEAHELFKATAKTDGKWITVQEQGLDRTAFAVQVRKNFDTFYIVASVAKVFKPMIDIDRCSSQYLEECSIWNAEALMGATTAEVLSLATIDEIVAVGIQVQSAATKAVTGDFTIFCYEDDWTCPPEGEAAGVICGPVLDRAATRIFESALDREMQAWVQVYVNGSWKVAFVTSMTWKPLGGGEAREWRFVSFIEATPANDRCSSDSDCPANAVCTSGYCECISSDFAVNNSVVLMDCGYTTAGMSCASVAGMDCTDAKGNLDLEACTTCGAGYFCSHGKPIVCPIGQYCPAGSSSPQPCPSGSIATTTGMAECGLCPRGSVASQAAARACTSCLAGTYAGSSGQSSCDICPAYTYSGPGAANCTACPGSTFSETAGATAPDECTLCPDGFAFKGVGRCEECFWGMTAPESDATSCGLAPELQIASACIGGFLLLSAILAVGANRIYHKRAAGLKRQDDAALDEVVEMAVDGAFDFLHPLILMNVSSFMHLTEDTMSTLFEGSRDAHRLRYIDSTKKLKDFQTKGHRIVFVSYQWLSWRCKGFSTLQLLEAKRGLAQVMAANRWSKKQTYVWIDMLSIPQDHREVRKLAVDSLYAYAKSSDAFLAVCCPAQHEDSGEIVNLNSYKNQMWCRAQLLAFCCSNGPRQVFLSEPGGFQRMPHEVIQQMTHVFQGKMPCCIGGHNNGEMRCKCLSLVLPLLAMYIEGSRGVAQLARGNKVSNPALDFFRHAVLPHKDSILPRTFCYEYTRPDGRKMTEARPLFRGLLKRADRHSMNSISNSHKHSGNNALAEHPTVNFVHSPSSSSSKSSSNSDKSSNDNNNNTNISNHNECNMVAKHGSFGANDGRTGLADMTPDTTGLHHGSEPMIMMDCLTFDRDEIEKMPALATI